MGRWVSPEMLNGQIANATAAFAVRLVNASPHVGVHFTSKYTSTTPQSVQGS